MVEIESGLPRVCRDELSRALTAQGCSRSLQVVWQVVFPNLQRAYDAGFVAGVETCQMGLFDEEV